MGVPLDHQCPICGRQYHHCDSCKRHTELAWRAVACTPECYSVFMAYREYRNGNIDKDQMRQVLLNNGFGPDGPRHEDDYLRLKFAEIRHIDEEDEEAEAPASDMIVHAIIPATEENLAQEAQEVQEAQEAVTEAATEQVAEAEQADVQPVQVTEPTVEKHKKKRHWR